MSGIIGSTHFASMFEEVRDNPTMQGLVTAIYEIGCLIGAMFILWAADTLGRRRAMMLGALIMIIGTIIQITCFKQSNPLAQFIVGRVITGVGNGINTSSIPTYQGERAPELPRRMPACWRATSLPQLPHSRVQ